MAIPFTKMQGAGNDYVYIDATTRRLHDEPALARVMSDRHFGIGSDGLILIKTASKPGARFRMHMYNADGSEAEMCGNGIRCVAKYLFDRGMERERNFAIETGAGVLGVEITDLSGGKAERVRISMGEPRLARKDIPMTGTPDARCVEEVLRIGERELRCTAVGMGNPHCVIFVDASPDDALVHGEGRKIETHEWFPRRTNVEFVQVASRTRLIQRTWERGAGETLACGTGAAAVCVAGVLTGRSERKVRIVLRGGELELEWNASDNRVYKTGPAVEVFQGEWPEA